LLVVSGGIWFNKQTFNHSLKQVGYESYPAILFFFLAAGYVNDQHPFSMGVDLCD
jgi:hypothetical protein